MALPGAALTTVHQVNTCATGRQARRLLLRSAGTAHNVAARPTLVKPRCRLAKHAAADVSCRTVCVREMIADCEPERHLRRILQTQRTDTHGDTQRPNSRQGHGARAPNGCRLRAEVREEHCSPALRGCSCARTKQPAAARPATIRTAGMASWLKGGLKLAENFLETVDQKASARLSGVCY